MISTKLRFAILARDGFRCTYCGAKSVDGARLEVDHVLPTSQGGMDEPDNLTTACWACNNGKRDRTVEEAAELVEMAWGATCVTALCIATKADQTGSSYRHVRELLIAAGHAVPPGRPHELAIRPTDENRRWHAQLMEAVLS